MSDMGFDAGLHASARWRAARRWILLILGLALFIELAGVPHLRWTYVEQDGRVRSGQYLSVTGTKPLVAGQVAPTCPLIALVPLDRSLWSYTIEGLRGLGSKGD